MHLRATAGGALVVAAASVTAWSLAYPQGSLTAALVRAVADCAAAITLGLVVVPMLDGERHRGELIRRGTAPLAAAGAVWLLAELTRLIVAAAQTAAVPVGRLGVQTTVEFALSTAPGRTGLFSMAAAAVVCVAAAGLPRTAPINIAVAGLAAVGVAARPLTGHFSESALGGLAVAIHALAAALWCGALAGLVLTVEHRGQWARVLPRFSQLSVVCVLSLLLAGALAAGVRLGSPSELYVTGYGRVLSAKIVVTAALVVLGWRNRTMWLPAARSHRATAVMSRSRSLTEVAMMAVALAMAAALAVTA
jgi:copper resistance protein D